MEINIGIQKHARNVRKIYFYFQHGIDGSEKSPEKDEGTVEHEIESNQIRPDQIALDNGILENKKPPENEEESKHANKDLQTGTYSVKIHSRFEFQLWHSNLIK